MENKTIISMHGGDAICVTFGGEKGYVEQGFNLLLNHDGRGGVSDYYGFKYYTMTEERLFEAVKKDLFINKKWEFLRDWRAAGGKLKDLTEKEENLMDERAEKWAGEAAVEKINSFEREHFMGDIARERGRIEGFSYGVIEKSKK